MLELRHRKTGGVIAALDATTLAKADLSGRDLAGVRWRHADFSKVSLAGADLGGARLAGLTFRHCDLRGVRLAGATVKSLTIRDCDLEGLDLTDAALQSVCLVNCRSLHLAVGLDSALHRPSASWQDASSLDVATVRASIARLPDAFVLGMGYSLAEIMAWRAVYPLAHPASAQITSSREVTGWRGV